MIDIDKASAQNSTTEISNFDLAVLYSNTGKIESAIPKLCLAVEKAKKTAQLSEYLKCQNLLLRIYANRLEFDKINRIKEELQDMVLQDGIKLTSKTFYTLGICAAYKEQVELALDYFQKALVEALSQDSKEDMCFAINGIAMCYMHLGKYQEALKEIYNLQVFFEVIDIPQLKMSSQILNAAVLRKLQKYDQAIDVLWDAYSHLKEDYHNSTYFNILYGLGATYYEAGNNDLAKIYLNLIKRSIDPINYKQTFVKTEQLLQKMGVNLDQSFDLVINNTDHIVEEKRLGVINFKNQFVLLELLNLFTKSPGKVFTKEDLVEKVWNQQYNPSVHDNKVYVTIKRLRKLIEPDYDKPSYIFRAKNGYYMNKNAKILLEA